MTQADAIRDVAKNDLLMTNQQVKDAVLYKYGLSVSSSAVINILGAYNKRSEFVGFASHVKKKAGELLDCCGDYEIARNVLAVARTDFTKRARHQFESKNF